MMLVTVVKETNNDSVQLSIEFHLFDEPLLQCIRYNQITSENGHSNTATVKGIKCARLLRGMKRTLNRTKRTYVIILIAIFIRCLKQTGLKAFVQDFCAFTEMKSRRLRSVFRS